MGRLTTSELLGILKNRESSYAFLSRIYREEVSPTLLKELAGSSHLAAEEETDGEGKQILDRFFKDLQDRDLSKVTEDLAAEYAGLFLNAGRKSIAPYESAYTSKEKILMQQARDEVLLGYRQEGLDRIREFPEPEDHIALEFEFMSILCRKTIECLENGDRQACLSYFTKQQQFIEKHLMTWVPYFSRDMEQAAHSEFYLGIAKLTREYLNRDVAMISLLIDESQRRSGEMMPTIRHIYISSGHNYRGHHGQSPGQHPIIEVEQVECVAGKGLVGDRYFAEKPGSKGQVTLFAIEVHHHLCEKFGQPDTPPSVYRHNLITEGLDLNTLIGKEFKLQGVRFFGTEECKPCYWMDQAVAPGAEDAMKGRGGLRAKILTTGVLRRDAT